MSRKNALLPYTYSPSPDAIPRPLYDLSSSFVTEATNVTYHDRICITATATGTPTGQLSIEVTNALDGGWYELPVSPVIPAFAGAGDDHIFDIQVSAITLIRLKYVATSGAGELKATITARES